MTPTQHTGSINLPVSYSQKSVSGFQGGNHLFRVNQRRVINDRVDLTKTGKSAGHLFNSLQSYQGWFADIVSAHIKYDFSICRLF
jgi:hypothetical protein